MKSFITAALLLMLFISCNPGAGTLQTSASGGYEYSYVPDDPLNVRVYKLKNGLTVYLSLSQAEPRIMTNIAVCAGGKNDPAHATGLAHYLEHIMFKGTADFGTLDWEQEKPLLDSIESLYESYRRISDSSQRVAFYKTIDKVSSVASTFALANEYDKIVAGIGAGSTNAYTTEDRTVYINSIPSNQIENWVKLEANRFRKIVPRLFHTELEAVYEEKNRSLDNDYWKTYEAKNRALFPAHPYGTQTVIGTIDHLKNPSILEIKKYFENYYRPGNVAICMSGDLDFDKTIALIDKYFGGWEPKENVPAVSVQEQPEISNPVITEVTGPDAEWIEVAFRFRGRNSDDYPFLLITDLLLSNSQAGLIDINLRQEQKVLEPFSYVSDMNDYSVHTLTARPRAGQTLEEVKDLLLEQIQKLKDGTFEDWLIPAIINDLKKQSLMASGNNYSRADQMVIAFTNDIPWDQMVNFNHKLKSISREDILRFVRENYRNNYALIYKRSGKGGALKKINKPTITPVTLNKEDKSPFHRNILESRVEPILPVFLDYEKDLIQSEMKSGIRVISTPNKENDLFSLYYLSDAGTDLNPLSAIAVEYLQYIGTSTLKAVDIKKEFYKLGCSFGVVTSDDQTYIYLSGLSENMTAAVELFESLLADPKEDEQALRKMTEGILKQREDIKKDKGSILWSGLLNYGLYGPESSFRNRLSNEALSALKPADLTAIIRKFNSAEHRILYYGPMDHNKLVKILDEKHRVPATLLPVPDPKIFRMMDSDKPRVYWTNYDMVQAEIIFVSKGNTYDPSASAEVNMFNEYFGGNMSSPVFQELRERRGLAYAASAGYNQASRKNDNDFLFAYIGTQADKQEESMGAMMELIQNFPRSENGFNTARNALLSRMSTERITREAILFNFENAGKLGLKDDIRKQVYDAIQGLTLEDVASFHNRMFSNRNFNIVLIGDRDRLDLHALSKYGKVQELSADELFGFNKPDK
ncbi:MAG: M16 family metallopeptidase [Cyclobacteriaceae bacterium]